MVSQNHRQAASEVSTCARAGGSSGRPKMGPALLENFAANQGSGGSDLLGVHMNKTTEIKH